MSFAVTAVVGATVVGAAGTYMASRSQSKANKAAANAQLQGQQYATDAELEMFYKSLALQQPQREAGRWALESLLREVYGGNVSMPGDGVGASGLPPGGPQDPGFARSALSKAYQMISPPAPGTPEEDYKWGHAPQVSTGSPLYDWQLTEGERNLNRALAARGIHNSGAGIEALSDFYRGASAAEIARKQAILQAIAGYGNSASAAGAQGALNTGQGLANTYLGTAANLGKINILEGQNQANMWNGLTNSALGGFNAFMQYKGYKGV